MPTRTVITYPESLRAMSMHFPYAWAIVNGVKDFELRTRATRYRGFVLIHASSSKDSDDLIVEHSIPPDQIVRRAIIGAAELFNCTESPEEGGFYYELLNPIAFDKPIPASGQQSIFWPASTPERDQAFKAAWEQIQAASQPTASFLISQEEDDLIRISSQKTDTSFLVESEGLWDYLLPDIQDGTINLSKGKYADLYDRRVDD